MSADALVSVLYGTNLSVLRSFGGCDSSVMACSVWSCVSEMQIKQQVAMLVSSEQGWVSGTLFMAATNSMMGDKSD